LRRIFVDSSVWIDHLRGVESRETRLFRSLLRRLDPFAPSVATEDEVAEVVVGDLVLAEVLRGIDDDRQRARVRGVMLSFEVVGVGGRGVALAAAEHYVALRRLGVTVRKAVDCLISAWGGGPSAPLLHADRDFLPFVAHRGLATA